MEQELLDESISMVSKGKAMPVDMQRKLEGIFSTAMARCEKIARKNGHSEVYSNDIRECFSPGVHNREIEKRCAIGKAPEDFNPELCKIRMGEVIGVYDSDALVKVGGCESNYRADFVRGCVKSGDNVSLHHYYIVEILDRGMIRKYFS
jgi:hydrogenase maturation factor